MLQWPKCKQMIAGMNQFELLFTCSLCAFVMDFTLLIMMPPSLHAVNRMSLALTSSVV